MRKVLLVLFINCILSVLLQSQDRSTAFDFWIGEWEVSWMGADGQRVVGQNTITKILDARVIEENFYDPVSNFRGRSLSIYNQESQTWHQAWVDNRGGYYNFIGIIDGEQRIFQTVRADNNNKIFRMRFLDVSNDALSWRWEVRGKGDNEWELLWKIDYKRMN